MRGLRCGDVLKGNSQQKLSVANMIELLLKSFLVYHSPMFEAWKVPKRLVEVSCDVTQHLVVYRTAVGARTNSSEMRTHTGQHSRLPCMHTLFLLDCTKHTEIVPKLTTSQRTCAVSVFPRLVLICLRSLLTCLQRKIQCQQKCIVRGQSPRTPKILSDNVLHNAIDRMLGVHKMFCCTVLPVCH